MNAKHGGEHNKGKGGTVDGGSILIEGDASASANEFDGIGLFERPNS